MNYHQILEDIEKILDDLRLENKTIPIIVEGDKDREALQSLNITGEIIRFNQGMSITDFCDSISKKYRKIILLTDWDKKGGFLCSIMKKNLESRVLCNVYFRECLAKKSMVRTVESLPSWIENLHIKINKN
jgi:5S rRNA maturation endonuclease (ribonuclease M5)